MINFDEVIGENTQEHNPLWPQILYRILIVGGSGSGKTNVIPSLISHQPDIDEIFLYAKDAYKPKYQYLMKKHGDAGLKYCKDPQAFMEYSNDMNDVYKSTEEYNPRQKSG